MSVRCIAGLLAVAGLLGCAGKADAGDLGQDCYRDTDCKSGLVCVANTAGNRVCSNDVKSLQSSVPGPPLAADAGVPPAEDAAVPDEPAPEDDAGTQ